MERCTIEALKKDLRAQISENGSWALQYASIMVQQLSHEENCGPNTWQLLIYCSNAIREWSENSLEAIAEIEKMDKKLLKEDDKLRKYSPPWRPY